MTSTTDATPPIFDGHNDILTKIYNAGGRKAVPRFADHTQWHITREKARRGGFAGGFFAIWIPSPMDMDQRYADMSGGQYDLPLPTQVPRAEALDVALQQAAILFDLQDAGYLQICTEVSQLKSCMASGKVAAILHMEGAEAVDQDFRTLDVLYNLGLRSLGPVWSRPTDYGHGVPFRYPSSPDIGDGLTAAGKELVRYCNSRKIMLDLSHLNEKGFWDVAEISDAPLVATHSNVHAICPHARNLTDEQLDAIRQSDGMVGVNFAVAFLRPDGQMRADIGLDIVLRHLDELIEKLGEDRVGFGSDFDGAMVPQDIGSCGDLGRLRQAMHDHGYSAALMAKLCHENWMALLDRTWGPA